MYARGCARRCKSVVCTMRSRRNKNTSALTATKNVAVTSRWIFSFTFCGGGARTRARRWNNIWPFAAVDFHQVIQLCCAVRACLRSSPRYTWCTRAAVVYYPNCIIALCLRGYNVSQCICHGAPRLIHGRSNGLIALSTQLRNCLQFTISRPDLARAHASRRSILRTFRAQAVLFWSYLPLCINQRCRSCDKCILI